MINNTVIVGRLAHDPELKGTIEQAICTFVIAAESRGSNVQFIRVKTFGITANQVFQYCKKGRLLACQGHLESKNNLIDLIADNVQFGPDSIKKSIVEDEI
jgi:single-stranded DNA-binding protein